MADRFGRQQKRKMRAALLAADMVNTGLKNRIAELENSLSMHHHLLDQQSQKVKKLEDEIDRAKRIIGHYSTLFEPTNLDVGQTERGFINIPVRKDFAEGLPFGDSMISRNYMFATLDILLSDTRVNYPDFGYHCMVNFGGKRWAYACDQRAIVTMPRNELVQLMADSLAHQIADDLNKAVAR